MIAPKENSSQSTPHSQTEPLIPNALEAAGIDVATGSATMSLPHNPDFENGRWFPTWRPF